MRFIITAIIIMIIALIVAQGAHAASYYGQVYSTTRPSQYGQYNYKNSYAYSGRQYIPANAWGLGSQPYYTPRYQGIGSGVYPVMGRSCNTLYGCKPVQTGHMQVHNALDYTYYKNPELFAVRYMNNHQNYVRGLWPQQFVY